MLKWLKARLSEPSTWTAFAAVAVYLGVRPEEASTLVDAVVILLGLVGATRGERGGIPVPTDHSEAG